MLENCSQSTAPCSLIEVEDKNAFAQVWWAQILYSTFFTCLIILIIAENSIVMWIIISQKKMRSATNVFIMHMSFSDILNAIFNVSFTFVSMLNSHWPFGRVMCVMTQFLSNVTVNTSVYILVAISIDRFLAIVYVLHAKLSVKKASWIIFVIWLLSAAISAPYLLYSNIHSIHYTDLTHRTICYLNISDTSYLMYTLFIMTISFIIPFIILFITYTRIAIKLCRSEMIGEQSKRQLIMNKSKRKAVRMLMMVTFIFVLCYLPYQTYFLIEILYQSVSNHKLTQHIYLLLFWIAMSYAAFNPLIYYFLNDRFRQGFKQAIHSICPCICKNKMSEGQSDAIHMSSTNRLKEHTSTPRK